MRVMVVGISGAGKSTFAGGLAQAAGLRIVELDLLNWQPGWYNLSVEAPDAFLAAVEQATRGDDWVAAGGYSNSWPIIWPRAEHVVWLDLPRMQVMRQVIPRSLQRAFSGVDVFAGCREGPLRLLRADHPIRWAWNNHRGRREKIARTIADPAYAHLTVHQCRSRADAEATLAKLAKR